MAYQVPRNKQSIGQDVWEFGPDTGTEFSVRRACLIPLGELEEMDSGSATLAFFGGPKGTPQGDYIRTLTEPEFQGLVTAWRADDGLTGPESPASDS